MLAFLGLVGIGLLFKFGVVTKESVVGLGKDVLGTVSSVKVEERGSLEDRFLVAARTLLDRAKNSILRSISKSLGTENEAAGQTREFAFAVVADSHEDSVYFPRILEKVKNLETDFLIHLGDLSNSGGLDKLGQAKTFLDDSEVDYYVIPGDHDYNWVPDHDLRNFKTVFGEPAYKSFSYDNISFIFLDNSDLEFGLSAQQEKWLEETLMDVKREGAETILVFTHVPLYNDNGFFPDKVMGKHSSSGVVEEQRQRLLGLFEDFEVDYIFSGDVHYFSQYFEPETKLKMVTVGAGCGGDCMNTLPQFAIVTVYKDGKIEIVPKPYKELEEIQK